MDTDIPGDGLAGADQFSPSKHVDNKRKFRDTSALEEQNTSYVREMLDRVGVPLRSTSEIQRHMALAFITDEQMDEFYAFESTDPRDTDDVYASVPKLDLNGNPIENEYYTLNSHSYVISRAFMGIVDSDLQPRGGWSSFESPFPFLPDSFIGKVYLLTDRDFIRELDFPAWELPR